VNRCRPTEVGQQRRMNVQPAIFCGIQYSRRDKETKGDRDDQVDGSSFGGWGGPTCKGINDMASQFEFFHSLLDGYCSSQQEQLRRGIGQLCTLTELFQSPAHELGWPMNDIDRSD